MVPVKLDALDPNLFATLGLGMEVSLSDWEKADDRSARDFGSSLVAELPVAAGESCRAPSSEGFCALAFIAAMSTFPTGSYAPFTIVGRSSPLFLDWARIAAISTFPIG